MSCRSVVLDGDKVDGQQALEWTDRSVRDFLKLGIRQGVLR